jgi:hypothetical protein
MKINFYESNNVRYWFVNNYHIHDLIIIKMIINYKNKLKEDDSSK